MSLKSRLVSIVRETKGVLKKIHIVSWRSFFEVFQQVPAAPLYTLPSPLFTLVCLNFFSLFHCALKCPKQVTMATQFDDDDNADSPPPATPQKSKSIASTCIFSFHHFEREIECGGGGGGGGVEVWLTEHKRTRRTERWGLGWMWSNSMNNNPSVDKMWIIIMLLLEEGLMEKCVTVSLRMTSIIMTSFYAIKEKRFVTVCKGRIKGTWIKWAGIKYCKKTLWHVKNTV